ncbi:hypothetical protein AK812_SmicGene24396 [Symbiodinium microadriaticum]|uniref:Uncharacterized protein n=1 Tax=Symbiodinium microadriaticum TaxID=2951 RepID=A0A1Q9DES8_SYMMI|nr:hypothetical protein AK812_SmicGene24396 [Symbiodinium microadriaticum]
MPCRHRSCDGPELLTAWDKLERVSFWNCLAPLLTELVSSAGPRSRNKHLIRPALSSERSNVEFRCFPRFLSAHRQSQPLKGASACQGGTFLLGQVAVSWLQYHPILENHGLWTLQLTKTLHTGIETSFKALLANASPLRFQAHGFFPSWIRLHFPLFMSKWSDHMLNGMSHGHSCRASKDSQTIDPLLQLPDFRNALLRGWKQEEDKDTITIGQHKGLQSGGKGLKPLPVKIGGAGKPATAKRTRIDTNFMLFMDVMSEGVYELMKKWHEKFTVKKEQLQCCINIGWMAEGATKMNPYYRWNREARTQVYPAVPFLLPLSLRQSQAGECHEALMELEQAYLAAQYSDEQAEDPK